MNKLQNRGGQVAGQPGAEAQRGPEEGPGLQGQRQRRPKQVGTLNNRVWYYFCNVEGRRQKSGIFG